MAENVRSYRLLARMSQEELALRMRALNLETWSQPTVSEVERHGRIVGIGELFALALVLEVSPVDLLDPHGPDGRRDLNVDLEGPGVIAHELAHEWARDQLTLRLEWTGTEYQAGSLTMKRRDGDARADIALLRRIAREERQDEGGPR